MRISMPMVCADRKLTPMPAMTACLIVSVLVISIATSSRASRRPNACSIEFQVSDPRSRTTNALAQQLAPRGIRRRRASGWSGAATITYGCGANGSPTMSAPSGGRTMIAEVGQVVGHLPQELLAIAHRER